ncbi:MAG: chemotaxis response regulator protein-glutamate methylesterase [Nitrospirota bacterium]|nr:chemotaxis response regulator protein-glutamate methylesterase [Nitrospirota bacterium]
MKTKILVVDDSTYTRQVIKKMLEQDPDLDVICVATDGIDAMAKTLRYKPHIITLDFEMPEMDGFSFLRWLMRERPTPVIMVSSHSDSRTVFKALELGAVDFIAKPTRHASVELQTIKKDLIGKVRGIRDIRMDLISRNLEILNKEEPVGQFDEKRGRDTRLLAIGSSTGGPAALQIILTRLPADFSAAIVISQHIPRGFTRPLAERLDSLSKIKIREAEDGKPVKPGTALICPGDYHLGLIRKKKETIVSLEKGTLADRYVPSVDFMMKSAARNFGRDAIGIILTGMGNDGREGMLEIKEKGGYTIAESEESAIVYGMPAEAIKAGAADRILDIADIPAEIIKVVNKPYAKGGD